MIQKFPVTTKVGFHRAQLTYLEHGSSHPGPTHSKPFGYGPDLLSLHQVFTPVSSSFVAPSGLRQELSREYLEALGPGACGPVGT